MQVLRKMFLLSSFLIAARIYSFGHGQKKDSFKEVIEAMAEGNVYEASYTVGYAGTISRQYQRFEKILLLATDQQLIDLAVHHTNAVVRLYPFQALKRKKISISSDIIHQFEHDKAVVKVLTGCIGSEHPLRDCLSKN